MAKKRKINPREPPDFSANDVTDAAEESEHAATTEPTPTTRKRLTVNLDHRKLSKSAKEQIQQSWKGRKRDHARDSFFRSQVTHARRKFGHSSVLVGDDTDSLVIGIPCPSLAFEFLIAQDCFPLGLVMQLVAKAGAGKSALLAEFGRWFDLAGGGMVLCENETKFNPLWYRSLMGRAAYGRMELHRCSSVEDWQRRMTFSMADKKAGLEGTKEDPGPGRTVPVLFGVDSVMGKQSEETQAKILGVKGKKGVRGTTGDGAASRGHPIEAQKITRYMRTIPSELDEWPFAIVLVNHLRIGSDDMGNVERNKSGGVQVDFQESFELELQKVGGHKKMIRCKEFEGYPIKLTCEKNSFGPTHRSIQTRLVWWYETDPDNSNNWTQNTAWDWDWSTVHLLDNMLHGEKADIGIRESLREIDFHLECPERGEVDNLAWSKSLGMTKHDALTWSETGALIREDPALRDKLRWALRINSRPLLAGDYLAQMDEMAEELP